MRASDPLEDLDVGARKAILWIACSLLLLVIYTLLHPHAAALVAMALAIPIIIFLHETGHYLVAKNRGMKVTQFFVGFGPRLWSFHRGETEYGVKAIPLGGYCRIIGMTNLEEIAPEDEERTYRSKGWGSKVSVVAAGPGMNFLIAIVLMFVVLFFAGDFRHTRVTTTLSDTTQGALAAGLQKGDEVIAINGTAVRDWSQVPELVNPASDPAQAGDTLHIVVRRGEAVFDKTVTLEASTDKAAKGRVVAGISPTAVLPHPGVFTALSEAPRQVADLGIASGKALGSVFSPSGISNYVHLLSGDKNADQSKRLVGPVGYGHLVSDAVKSGWVDAIGLLIAINVFLGLANLLPLFPLDGGYIAVASYERVASTLRRRRVQADVSKLIPVALAFGIVYAFLIVSSFILDFTHPVPNPF